MMELRCIGSCLPLFVMAIVFDVLGVVLLFVGIFGDVRLNGVFYGDFLIHTGALVLFASLAWWLMWYVGNIKVEDESLQRRSSAAHSVKQLARKLTERLSRAQLKDSTGEKTTSKSSTIRNVTWGKSTYFTGYKDPELDMIKCDDLPKEKLDDDQFMCYQNQGYEDQPSDANKTCKPIQEEAGDQKKPPEASDESQCNEASQDKKPEDALFTCYQNEGYEDSDATRGEEKPQEKKPDVQTQSQSFDGLL